MFIYDANFKFFFEIQKFDLKTTIRNFSDIEGTIYHSYNHESTIYNKNYNIIEWIESFFKTTSLNNQKRTIIVVDEKRQMHQLYGSYISYWEMNKEKKEIEINFKSDYYQIGEGQHIMIGRQFLKEIRDYQLNKLEI